jgi:UDP-N-acetylmuramoyl-tripeptide--D-alanyl-D-alanine ligase
MTKDPRTSAANASNAITSNKLDASDAPSSLRVPSPSAALFSAGEVGGIVGGACYGNLDAPITGVVVDSRAVTPDVLFVALPGDKVDGHDFIEDALCKGASCILASSGRVSGVKTRLANMAGNVLEHACLVFVEELLRALQLLAKDYRKRMRNLIRIGVTGSSGKTTTKECIGAALAPVYPHGALIMNEGNLNSDIGLALSMFAIRPEHRIGVFEMGMNRVGEMDELDEIYEPDLAVITNIGTAHIGIIGSRQKIAIEKKKIFSRFTGNQIGIVWENDDFKDFLKSDLKGRAVEYGLHATKGLQKVDDLGLSGWRISWMNQTIHFPLPGKHNLNNALAALSVVSELEVDPALAAKGLESVKPLFGRSEIFEGRIALIQDCYNANPDSMAAALDFVDGLEWGKRKVCILGSMLELGNSSEREHRNLGKRVAESSIEAAFFFGDDARFAYEEALKTTATSPLKSRAVFYTSDMDELKKAVLDYLRQGDLVLVKGSRGMALERLTDAFFDAGLVNFAVDSAVDSALNENKGGSHAS